MKNITIFHLGITMLLIVIPVVIGNILGMRIIRSVLFNVLRMTLQLVVAAYILTILFDLQINSLTFIWYGVMLLFAAVHVTRSASIKKAKYIVIIRISFMLTSLPMYCSLHPLRLD